MIFYCYYLQKQRRELEWPINFVDDQLKYQLFLDDSIYKAGYSFDWMLGS